MVLRLVLVGAVAGLGLNLPSRRDLESWGHSAQRWANARLAEWDTRGASHEGAFVYISETEAPAPKASTQYEDDRGFSRVVEAMAASFSQEMTAPDVAEPLVVSEDASKVGDVEAPAALAIAPPTTAVPSEPETVAVNDSVFEAVVDEVVSSFVADVASAGKASDPDRAFEAVVSGMVATFSADLVAMKPEREKLPATASAVEVSGDDLYSGVAYALNRANDGLHDDSPQAAEAIADAATMVPAGPAFRTHQLGNAVRLTREAVFAWASLLHGPAVVTLSR